MRIMDEKGRLLGKLSVIDAIIVLAVMGLIVNFVYKQTSANVQQIITANSTFYVTFISERVRNYSVEAVSEGDIFYKQYERQPLGTVISTYTEPAYSIMAKTDGTAVYVPLEDRYNLFITLEVSGSINDLGYYVNGNMQVSEGGMIALQSNRLLINSMIYAIHTEKILT